MCFIYHVACPVLSQDADIRFTNDVEQEANSHFQKLYLNERPITETVEMLQVGAAGNARGTTLQRAFSTSLKLVNPRTVYPTRHTLPCQIQCQRVGSMSR
jgi:hypothetical protein